MHINLLWRAILVEMSCARIIKRDARGHRICILYMRSVHRVAHTNHSAIRKLIINHNSAIHSSCTESSDWLI
jgi:hypothetical protein